MFYMGHSLREGENVRMLMVFKVLSILHLSWYILGFPKPLSPLYYLLHYSLELLHLNYTYHFDPIRI